MSWDLFRTLSNAVISFIRLPTLGYRHIPVGSKVREDHKSSRTETTSTEVPTTPAPAIRQCTVATGAAHQFPFMVSILNSATFDPLCAGFIYNEQYVVTPASCVIRYRNCSANVFSTNQIDIGNRKTVSMLNVTVGQFRFDRPEISEKTFPVSSVVLNPLYRESNQSNNIAIIKVYIPRHSIALISM